MEGASGKLSDLKRRYIQLLSAVLYNAHFYGFLTGNIYKGRSKVVCAPGLNCYSCPGAILSCPLGSLQGAFARHVLSVPMYVMGTMCLFGVLFGRVICGFLCPFGFLQELIYRIPFLKVKKSRATGFLSLFKYLLLVLFVAVLPAITLYPSFCKYICPAGTLEAGIPLVLSDEGLRGSIGGLFSLKVFLLILCVILCLAFFRGFCRFICPLGAFYSLFNPVSFFGVRVNREKCTGCGACVRFCKMDVKKVADRECIRCGECRAVCPEGAIEDSFVTIQRPAVR